MPQWQLEDDDSAYFGDPGTEGDNGGGVEGTEGSGGEGGIPPNEPDDRAPPPTLGREWIDQVTGANEGPQRAAPPQRSPPPKRAGAPGG